MSGSGSLPPTINLMNSANHLVAIGPSALLQVDAVITNGGFNLSGGGTLKLTAANNYSQNTIIGPNSTLMAANAAALGASTVMFNGGTLALRSDSATAVFNNSTAGYRSEFLEHHQHRSAQPHPR